MLARMDLVGQLSPALICQGKSCLNKCHFDSCLVSRVYDDPSKQPLTFCQNRVNNCWSSVGIVWGRGKTSLRNPGLIFPSFCTTAGVRACQPHSSDILGQFLPGERGCSCQGGAGCHHRPYHGHPHGLCQQVHLATIQQQNWLFASFPQKYTVIGIYMSSTDKCECNLSIKQAY